MRLEPGARVGPYEIVSPLGEGAMGEVYRARDSRLHRDVAIKRLPDALATDPDRLARFEREAKLLASLNHPCIATIHGVEESAGARALVMELVEGQTLAERLSEGRLPLDEALPVFLHIAEALEFAHDKGVIHRDLKPANIKLTPDAKVKVLDFGLAKAMAPEPISGSPMASPATAAPTVTSGGTQAGAILGTAAYMSPEQAKGKPVDRRADIWSFGVVMYEALTGRRTFAGETVSETLAAVMRDEPDLSALPAGVPVRLRDLIARCLTKDPRRRLQAIGEARVFIEDLIARPGAAQGMTPPTSTTSLSRILPWAVAILAVVAFVWQIAARGSGGPSATPPEPRRFEIAGVSVVASSNVAISPDGREIVTYGAGSGAPGLQRRSIDSFDIGLIPGSSDGFNPFFSPDGRFLGLFQNKQLCILPLEGGTSRCVAPADGFCNGDWGADGTIVFEHHPGSLQMEAGLMRIASAGGAAEWVTRVARDKGEQGHVYPQILPDGRNVLFTLVRGGLNVDLAVVPLAGGEPRIILANGYGGRYLPSGHLVYTDVSTVGIHAVPFDLDRLAPIGQGVEVLRSIALTNDSFSAFAVSDNGTLIYSAGNLFNEVFTVVRVDRSGRATPILEEAGSWTQPRVSPDGRSILLRRAAQPDCHLWLLDLTRHSLSRLTFEGDNHNQHWMDDGSILLSRESSEERVRQVYSLSADGVLAKQPVVRNEFPSILESATRDGRYLAITRDDRRERNDIFIVDTRDGTTRPFLQSEHDEDYPEFSPDGRFIAYTSNETGRREVYVRPFPGPGGKYPISTEGGTGAQWGADGRELFYSQGNRMMRVAIEATPRFSASAPEQLFENAELIWDRVGNYDLMPDGSFVMVRSNGVTTRSLRVVLDWFIELERLAPTRSAR